MPYITKEEKEIIDSGFKNISESIMDNPGDLNYAIHQVVAEYIRQNHESYRTYNDIMGALEGVKLELYRRLVGKYEDGKMRVHGDVKPYSE